MVDPDGAGWGLDPWWSLVTVGVLVVVAVEEFLPATRVFGPGAVVDAFGGEPG